MVLEWRIVSVWRIAFGGLDPAACGLREALCTLGNGYFATRGANPESAADGTHYPGTYVAGVYNRLSGPVAGRMVENESLVNVPNWLPLSFRADGAMPRESEPTVTADSLELDMYRGVLSRRASFRDAAGRAVQVDQRRFVSLRQPHLAGLDTVIVPANWSGRLEILTALDGTVRNNGVARYRGLPDVHLRPIHTTHEGDDRIGLEVETVQSGVRIAEAARTRVWVNGEARRVDSELVEVAGYVGRRLWLDVEAGDQVRVEKIVSLYTSRDAAISEPALAAREAVESCGRFDELLDLHALAWGQVWRRHSHELTAEDEVAASLNLAVFHLAQTVSNNTVGLDVGVPARGLHGEAYRGHVFWDEMFVAPVLDLHFPQLTRSLLLYRYRRLDRARQAAAAAGFGGAMFPWQSGSDGREESQAMHLNPVSGRWLVDASHLQHHVGAAVAWNVWRYFQATHDMEFLRFSGAELLLEIARFWSSVSEYGEKEGRFEIKGVMGPDEYHDGYPGRGEPGLDNNAYTNVMAVWCLCRALEVLEVLPAVAALEVSERVGLSGDELARWEAVSRGMRVCFHDGVISQFEGYETLDPIDLESYRARYGDIRRLDRILEAEGDTTNRYQVAKQADAVMLFYLFSDEEIAQLLQRLGYECDAGLVDRTIDFYAPRTVNGSSLGRTVDAWVSVRRGRPAAWEAFWATAMEDLSDVQRGTTAEGIHLASMAGYIDLFQRCFSGLRVRGDTLFLDPVTPAGLGPFTFQATFRGQTLRLSIAPDRVRVEADASNRRPVAVEMDGRADLIVPGSYIEAVRPSVRVG